MVLGRAGRVDVGKQEGLVPFPIYPNLTVRPAFRAETWRMCGAPPLRDSLRLDLGLKLRTAVGFAGMQKGKAVDVLCAASEREEVVS
jgi:hypothetical protein